MCDSVDSKCRNVDDASTAQLKTVSLQALQQEDALESFKLFRACVEDGIFYLDISQTSADTLRAIERIYQLEESLFDLREDELLQYDIDRLSPTKLNGSAFSGTPRFLEIEVAEYGLSDTNLWVATEGNLRRIEMDSNHTL